MEQILWGGGKWANGKVPLNCAQKFRVTNSTKHELLTNGTTA